MAIQQPPAVKATALPQPPLAPLQLKVFGTKFNAGTTINVQLSAPPNGIAYVTVCNSKVAYPLTAAPGGSVYSGPVPAPIMAAQATCPVVAYYSNAMGTSFQFTFPTYIGIVPQPIPSTDTTYVENDYSDYYTDVTAGDDKDNNRQTATTPAPSPTPAPPKRISPSPVITAPPPVSTKPVYRRYAVQPVATSQPAPVETHPVVSAPVETHPVVSAPVVVSHPVESAPAESHATSSSSQSSSSDNHPEPKSTHSPM